MSQETEPTIVVEKKHIDLTEDIKDDDDLKTMILKMNYLLQHFISIVQDLQSKQQNDEELDKSNDSNEGMGERQKTELYDIEKNE